MPVARLSVDRGGLGYTHSRFGLGDPQRKHPDIETGKGCINFKPGDELPVEDLKAVVRHAITRPTFP